MAYPSLLSFSTRGSLTSDTQSQVFESDSIGSSSWRLQLEALDESTVSPHIPVPFLYPTGADKASAARSSPLAAAILTIGDRNEQAITIKRLLAEKATDALNRRDPRGRTPLIHAIALGDIETIDLLVSCPEIDSTARDRFGNTTLMYACGHGYRQIVVALLKAVKTRSCDERWPTDMAAFLYAENYDENTAFTLAFAGGHDDCINVLSDYFKAALYEDERRKCSLVYRLGVRSAAMARALANLQTKNGISKFRRLAKSDYGRNDENAYQNRIKIILNQEANKYKSRRRCQSQEPVSRKSILETLITTAPPNMALDLAISYGKKGSL